MHTTVCMSRVTRSTRRSFASRARLTSSYRTVLDLLGLTESMGNPPMICTYNRAYGLGKDRSGAGIDSRVLLVIRSVGFESHSRSLRVLPFLRPGSMSQQSTAGYAIVPTSTPPLRVLFRPNPHATMGLIPRMSSSSGAVSPGYTELPGIRRYPVKITF